MILKLAKSTGILSFYSEFLRVFGETPSKNQQMNTFQQHQHFPFFFQKGFPFWLKHHFSTSPLKPRWQLARPLRKPSCAPPPCAAWRRARRATEDAAAGGGDSGRGSWGSWGFTWFHMVSLWKHGKIRFTMFYYNIMVWKMVSGTKNLCN